MKNVIFQLLLFLPILSFCQTAPDFTITTSDNEEISLYNDLLNNGKTVVIKLFFTSCPPCRAIAPETEALYQEWGAGDYDVEFISLSTQSFDSNEDVADYKIDYNQSFPGAGTDGDALPAIAPYKDGTFGQFLGTPTFIVIAPDGTVNYDVRGSGQEATINQLDLAIADSGAQKPEGTIINYYSTSGTIFGADGSVFDSPQLMMMSETGANPIANNPFQITDIQENTSIQFELSEPSDDLTQGVSTFDLVLITQHVLGIENFTEPYQLIAADANNDGTISTFDVIVLRQVLLSIAQELPDNRNWLIFEGNPSTLSENPSLGNTFWINEIGENVSNIEFTLLKIGDVNGDAY